MPRKESLTAPATAQAQQEAASDGIDNYELPKSLVTRIAKSAIPENSKLQKDTVTALVKGSTVFINFLAATAHDIAISKQHKSVSASDVLKALEAIQFGDMVGELENELKTFREVNKKKSNRNGDASASTKARSKGKGKESAAPVMAESISTSASASLTHTRAKDGDGDEEMVDVDAGDEADELESDGEGGAGADEEDQLDDDVDEPELEPEPEEDDEDEDDEEPVDKMAMDDEDLAEDRKKAKLGPGTETRE